MLSPSLILPRPPIPSSKPLQIRFLSLCNFVVLTSFFVAATFWTYFVTSREQASLPGLTETSLTSGKTWKCGLTIATRPRLFQAGEVSVEGDGRFSPVSTTHVNVLVGTLAKHLESVQFLQVRGEEKHGRFSGLTVLWDGEQDGEERVSRAGGSPARWITSQPTSNSKQKKKLLCSYHVFLRVDTHSENVETAHLEFSRDSLTATLTASPDWYNGKTVAQAAAIANALTKTWFRNLGTEDIARNWGEDGQYVLQFLHLLNNKDVVERNVAERGETTRLAGTSSGERGSEVSDNDPANELAEQQHDLFHFVLPWLQQYLLPALNVLFDFEVETQQLLLTDDSQLFSNKRKKNITRMQIQRHFLREASGWLTDGVSQSGSKLPSIKRFASYTPVSNNTRIVNEDGEESNAFAVSSWGLFVLAPLGETNIAERRVSATAQLTVSKWAEHLRSSLSLSSAEDSGVMVRSGAREISCAFEASSGTFDSSPGPSRVSSDQHMGPSTEEVTMEDISSRLEQGKAFAERSLGEGGIERKNLQVQTLFTTPIALWELTLLSRAFLDLYADQIRKRIEQLRELGASSWAPIEMPPATIRQINLAASLFEEAVAAVSGKTVSGKTVSGKSAENSPTLQKKFDPRGSRQTVTRSLHLLRQSLFLVNEAAFSESLLAQHYFSLEYKAAVFLPVTLPALVPLFALFKLLCARRASARAPGKNRHPLLRREKKED